MPETVVYGEPVFYRQKGHGEKFILFVHGAGGNSLHWLAVEPPAGWLALFLDLPGHGSSAGAPQDSIEGYAGWLTDFIEKWGEKPVLAGHSMGGAIALALALSRPELVSGLILVGAGAKLGVSPAIMELCREGNAAVAELVAKWAYGPLPSREKIQAWGRAFGVAACEAYLADFTACNAFDVRERLAEIALPALVVCGSEDRLAPPKYSHYLAEHLLDASLVEIPQAGHMVMLEQPTLFNTALSAFCRRL